MLCCRYNGPQSMVWKGILGDFMVRKIWSVTFPDYTAKPMVPMSEASIYKKHIQHTVKSLI